MLILCRPGKDHIKTSDITYKFDKIFNPDEDQESVYDNLKQKIIPNLLKGYNVTFISYGPTGAGKTYTVCGEDESFTPGDFHEDD